MDGRIDGGKETNAECALRGEGVGGGGVKGESHFPWQAIDEFISVVLIA